MGDILDLAVDVALNDVRAALKRLEYAINLTPTGPRRDALTEANINLMWSESKLIQARGTEVDRG